MLFLGFQICQTTSTAAKFIASSDTESSPNENSFLPASDVGTPRRKINHLLCIFCSVRGKKIDHRREFPVQCDSDDTHIKIISYAEGLGDTLLLLLEKLGGTSGFAYHLACYCHVAAQF